MKIFASGWSDFFDGPGRRFVFYLKGCNFKCRWCSNPEGLSKETQIAFYPERATGNFDFICPYAAIQGKALDRKKCRSCETRDCVNIWKTRCVEIAGREISPEEAANECIKQRAFMGRNGGVTFGGGEPSLQWLEVIKTSRILRENGIHTAIETNCSTANVLKMMRDIDLFICDMKCVSPDRHVEWTGSENTGVAHNLRTLALDAKELLVRITLIEGFNTDNREFEKISAFLSELNARRSGLSVEILQMHTLASEKYAALNLKYQMNENFIPKRNKTELLIKELKKQGVQVI